MDSLSTYLIFDREDKFQVEFEGFVDSDFVGDLDERRSLVGYVFTLFGNTISWKASIFNILFLICQQQKKNHWWNRGNQGSYLAQGLVNVTNYWNYKMTQRFFCDNQSDINLC